MLELDGRDQDALVPRCPFCGHDTFVDFKKRKGEQCAKCLTLSRIRSNWVVLETVGKVGPATKIAHFAPEEPIAKKLKAICGDNYYPYDLKNDRYNFGFPVEKVNMCTDLESLPQQFYDVVLHAHVLEHVPCNYTIVLQKLHGLLKPGGHHVFSFPVRPGYYREDQSPKLTARDRAERFGQYDHLRRFGATDFVAMVGCIFGITEDYTLADWVPKDVLIANAIPEERWTLQGLGPLFVVRKS